jgi:hypothetical protein
MSDDHPSEQDTEVSSTDDEAIQTTVASSSYKVLGKFDADSGAGVRGENTSDSGTPIGVEGTVPNNPSGYGLSTPDDARVGGSLTDASGNSHLSLNDGGPLAAGQTLDLGGNALVDSGTTIWDGTSGADVVTETASTFGESNVSISHSRTTVSNGAIELDTYSASRPDDDSSKSDSAPLGLEFEPQADLPAITATVSSNTSGESTVGLYDSDDKQLASEPSPGAGNSVTLTASMSARQRYYVLVDNGGTSYTAGYYGSPSFPYGSSPLYITAGAVDDSGSIFPTSNKVYTISKLEAGFQGSATVEFSRPSSVRHWRTATFQDEPDGETVEVYVETSSDGSTWSDWQSKPIGPGTDLAGIPSGNHVRFRAELSRGATARTPRLRLLSRQYSP